MDGIGAITYLPSIQLDGLPYSSSSSTSLLQETVEYDPPNRHGMLNPSASRSPTNSKATQLALSSYVSLPFSKSADEHIEVYHCLQR